MVGELPDDLKQLWQGLSKHPVPVSMDAVRAEAARLREVLRRRLFLRIAGSSFAIVVFGGFYFVLETPLQRVGAIVMLVGFGCAIAEALWLRPRITPGRIEADCVRFYRQELERRRDFLRGVWRLWPLAVLLGGMYAFLIGVMRVHPELSLFTWEAMITTPALAAWGVWRGRKEAQSYQRRIDALDRSQGERV